MKIGNWLKMTVIATLTIGLIAPLSPQAAAKQTILDESIYELLVDRYFNKTIENDFEVDARIPSAFAGGDFMGVTEKLDHIQKMGFTLVSLGPVFSTETYDGKQALDYSTLERHFGTDEEFIALIEKAHEKKMGVIADFPMQNVSMNHEWASDTDKQSWLIENEDGTLSWDYENVDTQEAVQKAILEFVERYELDGLRLTEIEGINTVFLNQVIKALKEKNNEDFYVISNEQSDAKFDVKVLDGQEKVYRDIFKNVDQDSSQIVDTSQDEAVIHALDSLETRRFTADAAEENMFPPTRWKMGLATLFSTPGLPMMTYGSEIAVNGEEAPESHPILNFKVDEELIDFISDVQSLRNQSEALRTGEIEMLHNEEGFIVYKRWNDEETWIIAINNSGATQSFDLSKEVIGDNKELRGLFESDIMRQKDDGSYRMVLDREVAEFYTVQENEGINKAYMVALALVYIIFVGFIYLVWRKGKQKKLAANQ